MSHHVTITVGGQPRGKANHTARGGISYLSGSTRDYLAKLQYAAQQEMAGRSPTDLAVRIHIEAVFQIGSTWSKRKREDALIGRLRPCMKPDCDNIMKLLDACNAVVWNDDKQIVEAHITKLYGEAPSLTVQVETIEPPALPAPREARPTLDEMLPGLPL